MDTVIINPINNIFTEITNFFKVDFSLSLDKFIQKLLPVFNDFNEIYENIDYNKISKKDKKKLLKSINFLIILLNVLSENIQDYESVNFWKKWDKTAKNLENLYDELDLILDENANKLLGQIANNTIDETQFVTY